MQFVLAIISALISAKYNRHLYYSYAFILDDSTHCPLNKIKISKLKKKYIYIHIFKIYFSNNDESIKQFTIVILVSCDREE